MVATTEADPVTQSQSAPDTSNTTDGAAAPKGKATNPSNNLAELILTQVETGTSNASAPDIFTTTNDEAASKGKPYIGAVFDELTNA